MVSYLDIPIPFFDFLFVIMGPSMGDGHESAGEKGVDDGQKKNERRYQIEWLLTDTVCQDADDASHILIAVCFKAEGEIRCTGRRTTGRDYDPAGSECQ